MRERIYPVLTDTTRIKKMKSFCWVSELLNDSGTKCTAKEAFILSLCSGEYSLEEIVRIYAGTFSIEKSSASLYVGKVIERFDKCLAFNDKPSKEIKRYEPESFIYDLKDRIIEDNERLESPAEMTLVMTNSCNFKCIYCYNSSSCKEKVQMDTKDWIKVVKEAKELGVVKCTLTGGEPLTHPGFFEILETLMQEDILTYICTNGSLINEEAVKKFKELKVPVIQISLDSPSEAKHEYLTQSKGTFSKVTNAIKMLVAAGIKVYVKAVVLPETMDGIGELIELCDSLGVANLVLDQYDLCYVGRGSNQFFLSKGQQEVVKNIVSEKHEEIGTRMNINVMFSSRCWSNQDDIVMCGAFIQSFIMMANGDYTICEKLEEIKEASVGNFKTLPLKKMWVSPKIESLMKPEKTKLSEPCSSCEYLSACKTGCFAAKQFFTDDIYAVDPRCWKAEYKNNPFVSN